MQYRELGRTGLQVSAIGHGTEHLHRKPAATAVSVIREAIACGINYFDVVFAFPEYRDNIGAAIAGQRHNIIICGHICCGEHHGQYRLTRDRSANARYFDDLLRRLKTDYVDIVMIQMVNEMTSFENISESHGIIDLVRELKQKGKARYIGVSGHKVPAVKKTVETGIPDVVMFPINIAWDMVPGRNKIYDICARQNLGLVGMKVFGNGRVIKAKAPRRATVLQCISYALAQRAVATIVPGAKTVKEIGQCMSYFTAGKRDKEYRSIIAACQEELRGNCLYCNHCLPCPQGIDIGRVIARLERTRKGSTRTTPDAGHYFPGRLHPARANTKNLSLQASRCDECGACVKRCPFDVDVIGKMRLARRR